MKADNQTEAEVMAVLAKLSEAYKSRDSRAVTDLFIPDPEVFMYGTGADEKRVGLNEIRLQAERDWSQAESTELIWGWHLVSLAGQVAWVAAEATFKVMAGGQNITMNGRMTAVLEKRGDKWLIAQAHFSMPMVSQNEGKSFPTH